VGSPAAEIVQSTTVPPSSVTRTRTAPASSAGVLIVQLAVNSIGHLAQGYQIYALGCVIMETYEVKALALTKITAGTP
jgi:hypothetical protein